MTKVIIFDYYKTLYNPENNKLFPGTYSLLDKLSNKYQLILITTFSKLRKKQISSFALSKYFRKIIYCRAKTTKIFQKYTTNPSETLIIGDRGEDELSIGKNLEIKTLRVNPKIENPILTIRKVLNLKS